MIFGMLFVISTQGSGILLPRKSLGLIPLSPYNRPRAGAIPCSIHFIIEQNGLSPASIDELCPKKPQHPTHDRGSKSNHPAEPYTESDR